MSIIFCCLLTTSCGSAPPHEVVGQEGIVRLVVISPEVAAEDHALWQIADGLRSNTTGQAIQVMFWIEKPAAGIGLPLTDQAMATQVAQININPATNLRELIRPRK